MVHSLHKNNCTAKQLKLGLSGRAEDIAYPFNAFSELRSGRALELVEDSWGWLPLLPEVYESTTNRLHCFG